MIIFKNRKGGFDMKNRSLGLVFVAVGLVVLWFFPNISGVLFPNAPAIDLVTSGLGYLICRGTVILLAIIFIYAMLGELVLTITKKIKIFFNELM